VPNSNSPLFSAIELLLFTTIHNTTTITMLASDLARWLVAPMGLACPHAEEEA